MSGHTHQSLSKPSLIVIAALLLLGLALANTALAAGNGVYYIATPPRPDAAALSPVHASIQRSTELDTFTAVPPATPDRADAAAAATPSLRIGLDSYFSENVKFYNIPVSWTFMPGLLAQVNLPLVTSRHASATGDKSETGLGDTALTLKYRDHFDETTDIYYMITAQFPFGDENKGLGSGAYEFSYTQKLSTWFGPYRSTFMLGVTIPAQTSSSTFNNDKVEYGPTISYMVAAERQYFLPDLWLGLSAAGLHTFNTRINGGYQQNSLTTLDLVPAVSYYTSANMGFKLGLALPVLTSYELPGAKTSRAPVINLSLFKAF